MPARDSRGRPGPNPGRRNENADFTCIRCKRSITANAFGTRHRNHCPYCLWSRHLDDEPGDRQSLCRNPMEPIAIEVRDGGEWAIIHRCTGCDKIGVNRLAGDDHELALLAIALRPLARPAFPLDILDGARGGGWGAVP